MPSMNVTITAEEAAQILAKYLIDTGFNVPPLGGARVEYTTDGEIARFTFALAEQEAKANVGN